MIRVFSITRENNNNSETVIVMDKEDLSINDDALIRVCAAVWPGTLDDDYGYFALPVDTTSLFVATSIQKEDDECWIWTVKFVAETTDCTIESIYATSQAVTEELAKELMLEKYIEALKELRGE